MVDLSRHSILQDIYNLSSGIEDIGVDRRLTNLAIQSQSILKKADALVQENQRLKEQLEELKARETATA